MLRILKSLQSSPASRPDEALAPELVTAPGPVGGSSETWTSGRAVISTARISELIAVFDGQEASALALFIDAARSEVDADSEIGGRVAALTADHVSASEIIDLARQGEASVAWAHAVFKKLIGAKRYAEAETLIRFVAQKEPRNGLYAYRLLDTLRRQEKTGDLVQTLISGQGDVVQVFRLADLFSRLEIDRRHFGPHLKDVSTVTLLRLLFALSDQDAGLKVEVRRHLARRRPLSVINGFVEVVRREGKRGADFPWREAVEPLESLSRHFAAAALIAAHKADDLDPVTLRRGRAALARARVLTEHGPVCSHGWGVYRAGKLFSAASIEAPSAISEPIDVLVTFGKTRPALDDFLSEHRGALREIRMADIPEGEIASRSTTPISALSIDLNSQPVVDCIMACRSAAERVAEVMCDTSDAGWRDVVALAVEDRLYPHYKKQLDLIAHLRSAAARRILVVLRDGRIGAGLELAWLLDRQGFDVLIASDVETRAERDKLDALWTDPTAKEDRLLAFARAAMGPAEEAPLSNPLEGLSPASRGGGARSRMLLTSNLADPSYLKACASLSARLAERGYQLEVFNGHKTGADRWAKLARLPIEAVADMPDPSDDAQTAVKAALSRLHDHLAGEGRAVPVLDPVRGNIWRLTTVLVRTLAADLDAIEDLVARVKTGQVGAVVTVPGRMTAARGLTVAANRLGVPVIDLQVFFISANPRYRPSLAPTYLGISEDQIEVYRCLGDTPGQEVRRAGSVMISDQLKTILKIDRAQARAGLEIADDRTLVVYGAQHSQGALGDDVTDLVAGAAGGLKGVTLIVKLHPRTTDAQMAVIRRRVDDVSSGDVRVTRDGDIYAMIRAADLVITQFSNVGLEAAVLGVPTLSINTMGEPYVVDLPGMGVADQASNPEELKAKVRALTGDTPERTALEARREAYFAANPELRMTDVADRVADLIEERWAQGRADLMRPD